MCNPYLIREIFEERYITPSFHVRALELCDLLKFGFLWIFVECSEKIFMNDEILILFRIMDFDVGVVRVDTKG